MCVSVFFPCFNGAAPVRTRIDELAGDLDFDTSGLQWGRAREDADRQNAMVRKLDIDGLLQWGRAREDADRQNAMVRKLDIDGLLQWGRAREDADSKSTSRIVMGRN